MLKPILAQAAVRAVAILPALLCFGPASTNAQAADSAADPFDHGAAGAKGIYVKSIKDGVAEYDARHFEEALGYFRRAHHLNPNARTFRGIGMTSFELRDYVTAARNLTAALMDQRKPLSAEQRKEAQDLLERCRMFVAVYTLKLSPSDAQVTVDANAPDFDPDGTLMLGLGPHVIEAQAKGYVKRSLSIQVRGGERKQLWLTLEPTTTVAPVSAAADPPPTELVSTQANPPPPSNRTALTWLWAGGGAALIAAGAGIYWGVQGSELASCRAAQTGYRCTDKSSLVLERNIGATTTIVTGAAALAMATIGILSWKSASARPTRDGALACRVGVFGLSCGRTF